MNLLNVSYAFATKEEEAQSFMVTDSQKTDFKFDTCNHEYEPLCHKYDKVVLAKHIIILLEDRYGGYIIQEVTLGYKSITSEDVEKLTMTIGYANA